MTARGMTRSAAAAEDDGHEFHDHLRPSMLSSSAKSILRQRKTMAAAMGRTEASVASHAVCELLGREGGLILVAMAMRSVEDLAPGLGFLLWSGNPPGRGGARRGPRARGGRKRERIRQRRYFHVPISDATSFPSYTAGINWRRETETKSVKVGQHSVDISATL